MLTVTDDTSHPGSGDGAVTLPPEQLAGLPCYNLYVGWRRVRRFYRGYFEDEINPQRMYVLELLKSRGAEGLTVSELARGLVAELGSISGLLSRMESEGLLVRERSEENRRTVHVRLTPAGRAACRRNERRLEAADERLHEQISKAEIETLRRINAKLERLLQP